MPISSYSPPDVLLNQELDATAETQVPRMAACVVAPKYRLSRQGKETVPTTDFTSGEIVLPWTYLEGGVETEKPDAEVVDLTFTKLHVANGRLKLAEYDAADTLLYIESLSAPNIVRAATGSFLATNGTTLTDLRGRAPKIGDKVLFSDAVSPGSRVRTVTALKGAPVDATRGTNGAKDNGKFLAGAYNPRATTAGITKISGPLDFGDIAINEGDFVQMVSPGANYGGDYAELITVTVTATTEGGGVANVTSGSGLWNATAVEITTTVGTGEDLDDVEIELENGESTVAVSLGSGTLEANQVFKFVLKGDYVPLTLSSGTALVCDGTYTGTKETTYVITVVSGTSDDTVTGAIVSVYDTAGADVPQDSIEITSAEDFFLGTKGLVANFTDPSDFGYDSAGLRTGDTYYVHAVPATESTTNFTKLVFDAPVVDTAVFNSASTALAATFFLPYTGLVSAEKSTGTVQWEADATDGVTVEADATVEVSGRSTGYVDVPLIPAYGKLSLSWRSAEPLGDLETFDSFAEVLEKAGASDIDNPFGYASTIAFSAAEGQRVYGVNTGGETDEDFSAALDKLLSQDNTCFIAGVTDDQDARLAVRAHCLAESAPDVKHFRKAYLGIDSPGRYLLLSTFESSPLTATISAYGSGNLKATITNADFTLAATTLGKNDYLIFPGLDQTYKISSILSDTEIILQSGPSAPIDPAAQCELWKGDHTAAVEEFLIAKANTFTNRRATLIWQEGGYKISTTEGNITIPNKYAAAWAAGRRSALPPHVGLTKQVCPVFDAMPLMYSKFTPASLNRLAAEGIFIISQKMASAPIQVRHQLTTNTDQGNLYYEDNITHIIDWLSFQFVDVTEPYIGVRNATSKTLSDIRASYTSILVSATEEALDSLYGPVLEGFENLVINLAPGTSDTFDFSVDVLISTPLNRVRITLRGRNGVVVDADAVAA